METFIDKECPTGETLSKITPEVLKQLGFQAGHIVLMKGLLESLGIPNYHLNPEFQDF
jgi:hypothetical protein